MSDPSPGGVLLLSDEALARLELSPADALDALERGLRRPPEDVATVPKLSLPIAPGHFFQAMPVASRALDLALVKWAGIVGDNAARGLPNVRSLIALNRLSDAAPLAILSGDRITAWRTAAMTALAARRLARADSATIAFAGVGLQARAHVKALRSLFPGLRQARLLGRRAETVASFASELARQGLASLACRDGDELLAGADIVVSSVPASPGLAPFLDARRLAPGAFAAMIDLGRSWQPESFAAIDVMATDDLAQSRTLVAQGKFAHPGPWAADLADLACGRHRGRADRMQRTGFVSAGIAICDLLVVAEIHRRALAAGAGARVAL